MDAKELLRQLIRYRFWIVLFIASLLPAIGYFVTAGTIEERTETKTQEIETAKEGAEKYSRGTLPNGQYASYTQEKIAAIEDDVDAAHRLLYERQAPLLDWPEEVAPQLTAWGRDIPEDISSNETQAVAYVYTTVYDDYAKRVYETVSPWDPQTGEGIVVTPPIETLLRTVEFDPNDPPSISKVWQYQENLWVRRSILEVIAEVNEKAGATDWESAPIKQINSLEVGNERAVDHRTAAQGFELKDPPEVTKGGQSLEPEAAPAAAGGMMGGPMAGMMDAQMGGRADAMMGLMGPMGGATGQTKSGEPVRFLQEEGVELFRDYPAQVSVLIDQSSIQNFLVEFENSPMSMRVLEVNWTRPKTRVEPPVKGRGFSGYAGAFGMGPGGGLFGMDMMMTQQMGVMGMGGRMGGQGAMGGRDELMMGMMGMMGPMGAMGGRSGLGGINQQRRAVRRDLSNLDQQNKEEEEGEEPEKVTIFDPYYNIVELQVYVQARFYYPPTEEETTEEFSPGVSGLEESLDSDAPESEGALEASPDAGAENSLQEEAAAPSLDEAGTEPGGEVESIDEPLPEAEAETQPESADEPQVEEEPAEPGQG